jgi:hypothetical protein
MELEDVSMMYFCNTIRINLVCCGHNMDLLPVVVHKHCNPIEAFDIGQFCNEVLANYLPQTFWYIVECQSDVLVHACLVMLAGVAFRNILRHKASHTWPPIAV